MIILSKKLSNYLLKYNIIDIDEIENHVYCFQIFFSTLINISLVLIISYISGQIINGILFLIYFGILRLNCGGFHFNNYTLCIGCFNLILFIILSFLKNIYFNLYTSILLILFSLICIFVNAPKESKNKRLTFEERDKHKKNIRIIVPCLIISLFFIGIIDINYTTFPIVAIVTSSILLL